MIRTPDQRLRVFISSTLAELGTERKAVKAAIERLKLIPVLFESGARPHAPQEIYRAYLDQSQVFVGIYGASYGWIGPGMMVSGLEEEFELSRSKPRLIYVKNVANGREPRLTNMLDRMKAEGGVSYQKFNTPEELGELVQNDLALMLSERFNAEHAQADATRMMSTLPMLRGPSIGRELDLEALCSMIIENEHGLVTVTGAGGTGKSRICLMAAHRLSHHFHDGAVFVPLATIDDPALVAPAIAGALSSYDNGRRSSVELLKDILGDKQLLVVLDNFEQVLPAATLLAELLDHCPHLTILVSSRTPLHVRSEHVYALAPLAEPTDPAQQSRDELLAIPSVDLFVQRAREASANLVLDEPNVRAIAAICRKLDGLPLAIELAAANMRMLQPIALQQRMEHTLSLLTKGARDLPERQRTMRATIAWSHDLLDESARALFRRLAVMNDRFTLEDAHAVGGDGSEDDTLASLEQLVDQGLVRMFPAPAWSNGGNLFTLLHVVREFALESLDTSSERAACERRHAQHFSTLAAQIEKRLLNTEPGPWMERMELAHADFRSAFRHWIATGDRAAAWRLIADQRGYWAHVGRVSEALNWCESAGVHPPGTPPNLDERERGRTLTAAGLMLTVAGRYPLSVAMLEQAVQLLSPGDGSACLPRALTFLGIAQLSMGNRAAKGTLLHVVELATAIGSDFDACFALTFLSEACMGTGDLEGAATFLERARPIVERHRSGPAEAMYLSQCGNLDLLRGRHADALANCEASVHLFDEARMLPLSGWAWWGLGYNAFKLGRSDRAREGFAACLDRSRRTSDSALFCAALLGIALLAHQRGSPGHAVQLLAKAEAIAASIGYAFWSGDRLQHAELEQCVRTSLTPEQLEMERARGSTMSQEEAIALAHRYVKEETLETRGER